MKNKFRSFWIIGAGKFGAKAVQRLAKKYPGTRLTVVDRDQNALRIFERLPVTLVCHEGASYLDQNLDTNDAPNWIVPAVPVHLAFQWVKLRMRKEGCSLKELPVPREIEMMLPNPVRGRDGQLFVSYADFLCPDNCSEPFDRCTFTGKPRKGLLYQTLEKIVFGDFVSIVLRSRQLAPGVGGYGPKALSESFGRVQNSTGPILYSTACLCHGVMHAIRK